MSPSFVLYLYLGHHHGNQGGYNNNYNNYYNRNEYHQQNNNNKSMQQQQVLNVPCSNPTQVASSINVYACHPYITNLLLSQRFSVNKICFSTEIKGGSEKYVKRSRCRWSKFHLTLSKSIYIYTI